MNAVLVLTCNNLDLTKQCIDSVRKQDVPTAVYIVDNGSKDGTPEWAKDEGILLGASEINTGFSCAMNYGLNLIFDSLQHPHCLCPGNDTILPPYLYSRLLSLNLPAVSAVQDIEGHRVTKEDLDKTFPIEPINPNPDFSCILWRREAWKALGGLDQTMVNYASDCDMHLRAHRKGIILASAQVPFFHYGSSTIKNADPKLKRELSMGADIDRMTFKEKWGFAIGSAEYTSAFSPDTFGSDA